MPKFVNDPADFLAEVMQGVLSAHPDVLEGDVELGLIKRKDRPVEDKVSVVSGSGAGHEPAHAMLVGPGMLDGACQGQVFAAPSAETCYATIKALATPAGVLVLVANYEGDRIAWEEAAERAREDGIRVELVILNDDVAVKDSTHTVGRRAGAGQVFVIKCCGAAAEAGLSLDEVAAQAGKTNANTRTLSVALASCTLPGKDTPVLDLGEGEMEVGVGLRGEPGRSRVKAGRADEIAGILFDAVADDLPLESGDRVALMVNGLGATPLAELWVLYAKVHDLAEEQGFVVARAYVGEFCTSLDTVGASLTMLKLDSELEEHLSTLSPIWR